MKNRSLTIANTSIHQDENGLFSLNDLHIAAGGEERHKPKRFLRLDGTKELINELTMLDLGSLSESDQQNLKVQDLALLSPDLALLSDDDQSELSVSYLNSLATRVIVGRNGGSYVRKELVYAYAMWISPAFHIKVIRAYDDLIHGRIDPGPALKPNTLAQLLEVSQTAAQLTQKALDDTDPFIKRQTLNILKHLCDSTGIAFSDPSLLGQRIVNDHPTLAKFWDTFESLNRDPEQPFNHSHALDDEIAINLGQYYRHCQAHGITLPARKYLIRLLRKSQRYPYLFNTSIRSRLHDKTVRCFVFKRMVAV